MKRMKRNGWNIETMNQYCFDNNIDYHVIESKKINKGYQVQLWALVKCPCTNHEAYWVWWNNFLNGYWCKKCYYGKYEITNWSIKKVKDFYKEYGLTVIDVSEWKSVDSNILTIDEEGYKYTTSITSLRQNGKSSFKYYRYNKYSLDNIKNYCKINRLDYDIISDKYYGIKEEYTWIYKGEGLPEDVDNKFTMIADSFINGGCGHPYFGTSNGEIIFENILKDNDIEYVRKKHLKNAKINLYYFLIFIYQSQIF